MLKDLLLFEMSLDEKPSTMALVTMAKNIMMIKAAIIFHPFAIYVTRIDLCFKILWSLYSQNTVVFGVSATLNSKILA